ncbi:MAG: DNA-binding protein WhiA [Mycoplasmataceae bacterium]|nr:DNA-binding protein WhiA [Mycoplasmataceae bacterium]
MSFALEIKKEVLSHEFSEKEALDFVSGLISSSSELVFGKKVIKVNNSDISSALKDLLKQLSIKYNERKENKNWIQIDFISEKNIKYYSSYFSGAFVGGGSISDSESPSYHLEIQFFSHEQAIRNMKFLNKYEFKFSFIQRRKMFVIYLKKSEQIFEFLRAITAHNSMLKFEDARINRDFYNQLNRLSNLDLYNQKKLATASNDFQRDFAYIIEHNLLKLFKEKEILFFKMKKKNDLSSLQELVILFNKKTGMKKTRAGLHHWIIKLRKIISENPK